MAIKWVIECDNCQAQEPLEFGAEIEADGGGMVQHTIMPAHWVTYRQNDRIKHYCGVECMSDHIGELTIEEVNDKQPPIKAMQQIQELWECLRHKISCKKIVG